MGPVSVETWDAWLDRTLPPPVPTGPAPRWAQAMAKRHAALSAEVKALYDADSLGSMADWNHWRPIHARRR